MERWAVRKIGRSLRPWAHDVGRWWIAVAVTFVGAIITLVAEWHAVQNHIPWAVVAVLVVLLLGSYLAYDKERSRRLSASPEHIDRLRRVTQNLFDDVQGKRQLRYTDGTPYAGGTLRDIWRSHVPLVAQKLDAYEAAGPALASAKKSLLYSVNMAVQSLDESVGWNKEDAIAVATDYADRMTRIDAGSVRDPPLSLAPRIIDPNRDGRTSAAIEAEVTGPKPLASGTWLVWQGPTGSVPDTKPIRAVFEAIRSSPEWNAAQVARDAVPSTALEAEDALEKILGKEGFPGACTDLCADTP